MERYWSPRRLPSSLWHVRGQISAKRRLEKSKPRVDGVTWKARKKCGTCARMHVAVSGLSVGSQAHRVPRSRTRTAAPTSLDATIAGG